MYISGIPTYSPYINSVYRPYITSDYSPVVANIKAIIDAQTAAILQPVDGLHQASSSYDIKISSYGQIQSDLAVLEATAQNLSGPNAFSRYSAKSTNPAIFTSYTQGSAIPGVYNVQVSRLAQGETLVSATQHTPMTIGSELPATVTFKFKNGDRKNVIINSNGPDGLSGIAASINRANIGISASVVSDGADLRLMLQGSSGASNAFNIEVSGNDTISHLLFYADGAANNAMSQTVTAQDSLASVNGTPFNGNSNVLAGIAGGLTVNLKGVGTANVAVSSDLSQISYAVQSFVDAYNIAQSDIATYLSKELSGDKTLPMVSGQLSSDLGSSNGQLSQIGITRNQDGTLSFNTQAFQDAYSRNPQVVAHLFTDNGNGLADQIAKQLHSVIQPSGDISSTINQLLQKIKNNQQTESNLQDSAFQNIENSAHYYVQLLAGMIVKQIMDQFLQSTRQQSNQSSTSPTSNNQLPGSLFAIPATLNFQLP
jgi:flagellar hook-associated protein 2